jgi:hypothetical protein
MESHNYSKRALELAFSELKIDDLVHVYIQSPI